MQHLGSKKRLAHRVSGPLIEDVAVGSRVRWMLGKASEL